MSYRTWQPTDADGSMNDWYWSILIWICSGNTSVDSESSLSLKMTSGAQQRQLFLLECFPFFSGFKLLSLQSNTLFWIENSIENNNCTAWSERAKCPPQMLTVVTLCPCWGRGCLLEAILYHLIRVWAVRDTPRLAPPTRVPTELSWGQKLLSILSFCPSLSPSRYLYNEQTIYFIWSSYKEKVAKWGPLDIMSGESQVQNKITWRTCTVESFQVNLTFARKDFQYTYVQYTKNSLHHQNLNDCFNSIYKQEPVPNLTW